MVTLMGLAALTSARAYAQGDVPKVIAHRGFWQAETVVPHNSLASLRNAAELGCFGTEFDIWLTADDVPVVFHDARTKGGVVIEDVTYAELMERDGLLANGEKIPTLDEYLMVWKKGNRKVKLIFEIKSHRSAERDREAAAIVQRTAKAHKIKPHRMEYIAFSRHVCKALTDMRCGVPVAYLSGDLSPADAKSELGCTGIDYHMGVFRSNPHWIGEAHGLGMTVNVWTVNKAADLEYFIGSGVDYITTDRPDVLTEMLSRDTDADSGATPR